MRVIAVVNQKGGVAKTTSTYNLAAIKALSGKKTVMIDLDPQASLTISCGYDPDNKDFFNCRIDDVLLDETSISECCFSIDSLDKYGKVFDNLSLVPSSLQLSKVEKEINNIPGYKARLILKNALSSINKYVDYVFIDCPPQFSLLTINALMASSDCIIPTKVDYLSYKGLQNVLNTVRDIQDSDLNPNLKFIGTFATFYRQNVRNEREMLGLIRKQTNLIGSVKESADAGRHMPWGLPVVIAMPKSPISLAYKDIAEKI